MLNLFFMEVMLDPYKEIHGLNGVTVGNFWSWAFSDILINTNRAIFAEFLVGTALNVINSPRREWDNVDLYYCNKAIEVKCSAYLQSWDQKKLSSVKYDIGVKQQGDAACLNKIDVDHPIRASECYVFCLYKEIDKSKADVLDIFSWEFYIMSTSEINNIFPHQKSISLSVLQNYCNPVAYQDLKKTIDHILGL